MTASHSEWLSHQYCHQPISGNLSMPICLRLTSAGGVEAPGAQALKPWRSPSMGTMVGPRFPPGVSMLPVMPTRLSKARQFWMAQQKCSTASMYWMPPLP